MSSEKRRYFSSIMRLIYVNFGPFRHRSRNNLEKMTKKKGVGWMVQYGMTTANSTTQFLLESLDQNFNHGIYITGLHFVFYNQLL